MGGFSCERDRKKCEIAGFLLLCEINVGCRGFRRDFRGFEVRQRGYVGRVLGCWLFKDIVFF